jgi:hypothetical protein
LGSSSDGLFVLGIGLVVQRLALSLGGGVVHVPTAAGLSPAVHLKVTARSVEFPGSCRDRWVRPLVGIVLVILELLEQLSALEKKDWQTEWRERVCE